MRLIFAAAILLFYIDFSFAETMGPAPTDIDPYEALLSSRYTLFNHNRSYIMPFSYVENPSNDLYPTQTFDPDNKADFYSKTEAELQISFFIPVYRKVFSSNFDLIFAYSHHSWWQAYNSAWSRPFRETNYSPEIFFRNVVNSRGDSGLLGYDLGYIHESNGQIQLVSRSWNRIFGRAVFANSDRSSIIKFSGWIRLPDGPDDDNSDIQKYMGVGSIEYQKSLGRHSIELEIPIAIRPGVEFRYSYPWRSGLRWFADIKYGYGQSLIEYDRSTRRAGFGIMLENFADQN